MDGYGVVIALRPRTREALRHERATVLQQLATPPAAAVQADWAANRARAAELRRKVGGGESDAGHLGLVTGKTLAGGKGTPDSPCHYCGQTGGHTADCPVIS